jgi:hypothetical protein
VSSPQASWKSTAAASAFDAVSNTASAPSPVPLTNVPSQSARAWRNSRSCSAIACAAASGAESQIAVDPSTSVKTNVRPSVDSLDITIKLPGWGEPWQRARCQLCFGSPSATTTAIRPSLWTQIEIVHGVRLVHGVASERRFPPNASMARKQWYTAPYAAERRFRQNPSSRPASAPTTDNRTLVPDLRTSVRWARQATPSSVGCSGVPGIHPPVAGNEQAALLTVLGLN